MSSIAPSTGAVLAQQRPSPITSKARPFRVFTQRDLERIEPLRRLSPEHRFAMRVVSSVLPFRVNAHVIDDLIDWERVPEDPIFQLVFPQPGMLEEAHFSRIADLLRAEADEALLGEAVREIRAELNPHPAGQMENNLPRLGGEEHLQGMQHKYRETVLFFPSQGQTCHAYCSFCFRWAQFVGDKSLRIASNEVNSLHQYLRHHPRVSDLLITGGDPMVMKTRHLETYLEPLLRPEFDHIQTIRIGTKALTFWPYRFTEDSDSDALMALFERLVARGKHLALMAHVNHWRELESPAVRAAIARVRESGAEIRTQGPLLAHINDDPSVWARSWKTQVRLGMVPYYLFVQRDTGARRYFEIPLVRAWEIYREAMQQVSGLGRTARGPSMSAGPGKIEIQGVTEVQGERLFVLRFLQGRNPDWVNRPFFARFDPEATWFDDLKPAFGERDFFFSEEYRRRWPERPL
ncbi:MAG: lysine 2,3-aminomutase [Chromatiaceae bacterium]|nr:lysine 2,3-aminomutase [Chromatiaceae bacterium]